MPESNQLTRTTDKTTAAVPDSPDVPTQTATATELAPQFQGITDALTAATKLLSKREVWQRNAGCTKDCLGIKIKLLVWEIACTLKFVIIKLGLGKSLSPSMPRSGFVLANSV